jgi:UDP-N-acetylmuramoylalanine--D-glutamate ligase
MYKPGMFKNKKITVMGLGLLGRGVGDVKFLAEEGAKLIVTDLKTKEELKSSLDELKHFKNIEYVLGEHRLEDFRNRDFILKAAGVPLDSPYIAEARKNNIPIEMSTALFAWLSPAMIVGITGTRGKSTVTHLLYEVLQKAKETGELQAGNIFLGGNVKGVSTLAYLPTTKEGDIAVLELDSWQLQGFGESRLSPHISIFTTFLPDHMNYYRGDIDQYFIDKAQIFAFHDFDDCLIISKDVKEIIKQQYKDPIKGEVIVANPQRIKEWNIAMPGEHNRYNVSLVLEAAQQLAISEETVREVAEHFKGIPGRLEFIKEYKGVKIYNDTNSTTPDATLVALESLKGPSTGSGHNQNIVLIMGGANKTLDMKKIIEAIPKYCKAVILLPGTGTDRIKNDITDIKTIEVKTLEKAVTAALNQAQPGDILLFSPGFASFGLFKNEYDRGEQFNALISKLSDY